MSTLPAHLLLLLLLPLLLRWAAAATFTCAKPSTCHSAVAYVVPTATTYEELASRFSPATTLHDLLVANQLPPHTDTSQAVPVKTALSIAFRCRCGDDGVGRSALDIYTDGNGDDYLLDANKHALRRPGQKPLPCSCDEVDGSHMTHLAYIVRTSDTTLEIAAK
jgi:chitin elicitor-binding protein